VKLALSCQSGVFPLAELLSRNFALTTSSGLLCGGKRLDDHSEPLITFTKGRAMANEAIVARAQTERTMAMLSTLLPPPPQAAPKRSSRNLYAMIIAAVFVAAVLAMVWQHGPIGLKFVPSPLTVVPTLLGSMLLVSLFIERAVEVFVSVFGDPKVAAHEQNLEYWQAFQRRRTDEIKSLMTEKVTAPLPDDARKLAIEQELAQKRDQLADAVNNADAEEKVLSSYRASRRRVTAAIGLGLGVLAASVGFRFFCQIVELDALKNVAGNQAAWFGLVDVLLTGAVLSGGSQAIHQILAVYTQFMESTQKSVANRGADAANPTH